MERKRKMMKNRVKLTELYRNILTQEILLNMKKVYKMKIAKKIIRKLVQYPLSKMQVS